MSKSSGNPTFQSLFYSVSSDDVTFNLTSNRSAIQVVTPPSVTGLHRHPIYEVQCILSGTRFFNCTNSKTQQLREFSATTDEVVFLPRNVFHSTRTEDPGTFLDFSFDAIRKSDAVITADPPLSKKLLPYLDSLKDPVVIRSEELSAIFRSIRAHFSRGRKTGDLCSTHQHQLSVCSILLFVVEYLLDQLGDCEYRIIETIGKEERKFIIQDFIALRYALHNPLPELAACLHLSERQTQNVVQQYFGESFKKLILRQKMEVAEQFICGTNLTLNLISEYAGYASYSSFYTAYMNFYGRSPLERLREVREDRSFAD